MTDALMDRIKAHRSAPDVYDPPTFDQMADSIEQLEAACWRMQQERDRAIGWSDRDQSRAEVAEAKLAKAMDALQKIVGKASYADDPWSIARAGLAERERK